MPWSCSRMRFLFLACFLSHFCRIFIVFFHFLCLFSALFTSGSPYACKFLACGQTKGCSFLVMQLLGPNLSELRRSLCGGRFSVHTTALLALQAVSAIEALHNTGYVHRDIKPSNFGLSLERDPATDRQALRLIDFGLARKFTSADGSLRPARPAMGFRGTARYASINSHLGKVRKKRGNMGGRKEDEGRRSEYEAIWWNMMQYVANGINMVSICGKYMW